MSKTLRCPKCGSEFEVDETQYANLLSQVKNEAFEEELKAREEANKETLKAKAEAELAKAREEASKNKAESERAVADLKSQIALLQEQAKSSEAAKKAEIEKAIADAKTQNEILEAQIKVEKEKAESLIKEAVAKKETEIAELKGQIQANEAKKNLEIEQVTSKQGLEIETLKAKLKEADNAKKIEIDSIEREHAEKVKILNEQVGYYKDLKSKMSNKIVGESLEQHCSYEFNRMRMSAFPYAYFEKDNDTSINGQKGDFIFRDYEDASKENEIVSIMFEMKNENDDSVNKHKNEDFLGKLDKDRKAKGCEYAVLVTLLEPDNELYNQGIVDVSYVHEKMYVIRPQFFLPLISMLRNANRNALDYKKELAVVRTQNLDVAHFEENLQSFKETFGRNYRLASEKFQNALDEIDKTIDHLTKVKSALVSSGNNLRLANDKAEDLTIKRLTKNAPSVAQAIKEASKQ